MQGPGVLADSEAESCRLPGSKGQQASWAALTGAPPADEQSDYLPVLTIS